MSPSAPPPTTVTLLVPAQTPPITGIVRDLSTQSLAIDSAQQPAVDSAVMFDLPYGDQDVIRIRGIVSWTRDQAQFGKPAGFGVHFVGLSSGAKRGLKRLIDGLGPTPAPAPVRKKKPSVAAKPSGASGGPRSRLELPVRLRLSKTDPPVEAVIRDAEPRGLLLSTAAVLEVRDRVSFHLKSHGLRVRVRGRVVEFSPGEPENSFSLVFKAMQPEEIAAVQQITLAASALPESPGDIEVFGWDD